MTTRTRKPLEYYLALSYPFRADADNEVGGYVISFPDLPGCLTQVETPEEIGPAAEEVRHLWITTEYEDGEDIPLPTYPDAYSGKFNLRLPKSLHRRLAESAEREGVSLNQLVVSLLAGGEASSQLRVTRQLHAPRIRQATRAPARPGKPQAGSKMKRPLTRAPRSGTGRRVA